MRGGHRRCRDDVWSWIGKRSSQRQCHRASFAFRRIVNGTDRRLCSPSLSSSPLLVEPPRPSLQEVLVEIKVRRGGAALLSIRRRFPSFVFFLSLASAS
jgi:hypothetical protein